VTFKLIHAAKAEVPISESRLLTALEVANRLGVSERWVRDHATRRHPRIAVVRLGHLLRFRQEDIDNFLISHLSPTASKIA
jgi:excisionase family DNA binding protein